MQTLSPGMLVSHYRIVSIIGIGGMGEIYRAVDTLLDRPVALKILSQQLVQSSDSVDRFVQEARAASALNHPNIVTVHEIGTAEVAIEGSPEGDQTMRHIHFIAMELIDGETLRALMDRSSVTLDQKLQILAQAADGLAKAHKAGIVHRDLKPDNIMVTTDGFSKVLDFGLAKLVERDRPLTDSAARRLTAAGSVVGTIGYMAPEQIEGKEIDHRADVFSFGCILYQAVTGRSPFETDSMIETLHRIVNDEREPVRKLAPAAPPELANLIERCLRKQPDARWQSMQDLASELHRLSDATKPPEGKRPTLGSLVVAAIAVVIVAIAAWLWLRQPRATSFDTMRITAIPGSGSATAASISPDGKYVAYAADDRGRQYLMVRHLATDSEVRLVAPGDVHFVSCSFSPGGDYVYYVSADNRTDRGTVYRIATLGGLPKRLIDDLHARIDVSPDGHRLAYSKVDRGRAVSALLVRDIDSGAEQILTARRLPDAFGAVTWSPNGKSLAYSIGTFAGGFHTILGQIDIGSRREMMIPSPRWRTIDSIGWIPNGKALIINGREQPAAARNQLWLLSRSGSHVHRITNDLSDYEALAVTKDGTRLVTLQKTTAATLWFAPPVDAAKARQILTTRGTVDGMFGLACTPSGGIVYSADAGHSRDLWITDVNGKPPERLTDGRSDVYPAVASGGRSVVFVSMRSGRSNLWRADVESKPATQLTDGNLETSPAFSADGKWVLYHTNRSGVRTVWRVPAKGGTPVQVTTTASSWPSPSPDGKVVACSWFDRASGRAKIALVPFDGGAPLRLFDIPVNFWMGGNNHLVRWRGDELTYVATDRGVSNIWSQRADGSAAPVRLTNFTDGQIFYFDWTHGGKDLVVSRGQVTSNVVTIESFR